MTTNDPKQKFDTFMEPSVRYSKTFWSRYYLLSLNVIQGYFDIEQIGLVEPGWSSAFMDGQDRVLIKGSNFIYEWHVRKSVNEPWKQIILEMGAARILALIRFLALSVSF